MSFFIGLFVTVQIWALPPPLPNQTLQLFFYSKDKVAKNYEVLQNQNKESVKIILLYILGRNNIGYANIIILNIMN